VAGRLPFGNRDKSRKPNPQLRDNDYLKDVLLDEDKNSDETGR
jgi:hypothetical protein